MNIGLRAWVSASAAIWLAAVVRVGAADAAPTNKWEGDIARFEAVDRTNPPPAGASKYHNDSASESTSMMAPRAMGSLEAKSRGWMALMTASAASSSATRCAWPRAR